MNFRATLLIAVAIAQAACVKPPEPICQELDATIDGSIQRAALTLAEGDIYDKGAMQQAARYISVNNHLQVIRISLDLQKEHKCPIRKSAINPMIFETAALSCLAAKDEEKQKLCDIKNWKGN